MSKERSFIFSQDFDKTMSTVGKKPYFLIEKNLKKLSKNTLKLLSVDNFKKD